MGDIEVNISDILNTIRREDGGDVQDAVRSVLASNDEWQIIAVDRPLLNDDERKILDSLLSSGRFTGYILCENLDAEAAPAFLRHALLPPHYVFAVFFRRMRMSVEQADERFSILQSQKIPEVGFMVMHDVSEGVLRALERFLRGSATLCNLTMVWDVSILPSQAIQKFRSICNAIGNSSSIQQLTLMSMPVETADMETAIESLSEAVLHSSSLTELVLDVADSEWTRNQIQRNLLRSKPVKTFEFIYRPSEEQGFLKLEFERRNPWKRILADDELPLSVWPHILVKTKRNSDGASHSSLDSLFYLIREKSPVLLQNVHRRRIRKRKRFQFE